ncbi:scavenger receptor cysteine-rich type 1 protein M130-like [Eucyclogobius newberryi]|uniref:scavenger receptor cysteine-rich type 1 protein M130-like n=1 Tax=Eucyclogobius newberryi TaxID=166745 RepID=UPI003B5ACAD2
MTFPDFSFWTKSCYNIYNTEVEKKSPVWEIRTDCVKKFTVKECVESREFLSPWALEVKCLDLVRLVSGSGLCSGSVQIWDQSWTWFCEEALDLQGAEVLCRELGCGAPSLLQGALSPLGLQMFHCEGHESALMDCTHSSSGTCSSGAAVNLICSEPLRLMGGASRCAGTVEDKLRGLQLLCVETCIVAPLCLEETEMVSHGVVLVLDGASEALPQEVRVLPRSKFRVKCSVEPQFPGGSFQVLSPTVNLTQNHTLPAVNHSAHKGNYTCVYHLQVFNHAFSS